MMARRCFSGIYRKTVLLLNLVWQRVSAPFAAALYMAFAIHGLFSIIAVS